MRAFFLLIPLALFAAGLVVSNMMGVADGLEMGVALFGALVGSAVALALIAR
jgi:hypothetical protein